MIRWGSLVIAAAAVGLSGWAGYEYAAAQGQAALQTAKNDHAEAREKAAKDHAAALKANQDALAAELIRGNTLATQLVDQRAAFEADRRTLQRRIRDVTTHYQPEPGAALRPLPTCILTVGWVRDYNAAIGAHLPATDPGTAGGVTRAATTAAETPDAGLLLGSGVTLADVLAHITDYGAECRGVRAQVDRLIDRWEARQ